MNVLFGPLSSANYTPEHSIFTYTKYMVIKRPRPAQQVCFKYGGDCNNHPEWAGAMDDSDYAYVNLDVSVASNCLDRAVSYRIVRVRECVHATCACVRECVHACACVCMRVHACACVCMRVHVCACVRAHVCVCVLGECACAYSHTCTCAYTYSHMH